MAQFLRQLYYARVQVAPVSVATDPTKSRVRYFISKENRCLTSKLLGRTQNSAQHGGAGILTPQISDAVSRGCARHGNDTSAAWP